MSNPPGGRVARTPSRPIVIPDRVADRAVSRWRLEGECWISTYSTASHGYAQIGWQDPGYRQVVTAHRAAWVAVNGQIPPGMTIDHLCKNRRCVRPDHLRCLDNLENARRTSGRDWKLGQCLHGHDDATFWRPKGPNLTKGYCAECRRNQQAQRKARA